MFANLAKATNFFAAVLFIYFLRYLFKVILNTHQNLIGGQLYLLKASGFYFPIFLSDQFLSKLNCFRFVTRNSNVTHAITVKSLYC